MNQGDHTQWIRISCATLCRIEHPRLGYFLLLNRNRRDKGLYILSPIGGALEFHDDSIVSRFGAMLETPDTHDLRMLLPVERVPAFREWFYARQGRETSPFRELREELVQESKLLTALNPQDMQSERLWTVEQEQFTERSGQTGLLTHYFLEVYAVRFTHTPVLAQLIAAPRESGAMWLNAEQIASADPVIMHVDGAERQVSVNARVLFEPPGQSPRQPSSASGPV